jgi:hypothetical protein
MRTFFVIGAIAVSCAGLVAVGSPALAAHRDGPSCAGGPDTWTSLAGDTQWTTGGNWSTNAPPTSDQIAILPTTAADNVELNGDAMVCELQLQPETSLLIDTGHTLTAQAVDVQGGSALNAYTSLTGQVTTTDLHVQSGYTNVAEADAGTPVIDTTATFELDAGAHLSLADSGVTLRATSLATLGGSGSVAHLDSNSTSDGDDSAKFDVEATAMLGGAVDSSGLDVITTASSIIDTAGHTWTVHGDAFSQFADGTSIRSSTAGGVYAIGNQDHVLLSGTTSVGHGATLRLQGTGMLTDGRYFNQSGAALGTVSGPGTFRWTGGAITGHVDLAASLSTVASGNGARQLSDPTFGRTVVTNAGTLTLQGGSVIVADTKDSFTNTGRVTVTGGHFGANTSSAPPVSNAKGATWTVAPTAATSKLTDGNFRNAGSLIIAAGKTFAVGYGFQQTRTGSTSFTVKSSTVASHLDARGFGLAGTARITSAPGFAPRHATVKRLLKGQFVNGKFGHVVSRTRRAHTAWHLTYTGGFIDAVLR